MECLGFEPGTTGWKAYMNPLSYGGRPQPQVPLLLFNSATSASETQVVRWIESNKMSKPKVPIENTCLKIFGYAKLLRFFAVDLEFIQMIGSIDRGYLRLFLRPFEAVLRPFFDIHPGTKLQNSDLNCKPPCLSNLIIPLGTETCASPRNLVNRRFSETWILLWILMLDDMVTNVLA